MSGRSGDAVRIDLGGGGTVEATDLLVATGRTPNTDSLDAYRGGVDLDDRGYVRVNDHLETSAAGAWTLGECAGSPPFIHAVFDDFRVVRDNLRGGGRTTVGRLVPYCLFTDLELVHVGLFESQARVGRSRLPAREGPRFGDPPHAHPLRAARLPQGARRRGAG